MKVLMIGNSYTFFHDMPKLLEGLAQENQKDIQVDSVTKGGARLKDYLVSESKKHGEIEALLSQNSYDILVLQEQSYYAIINQETYEEFENAVDQLIRKIQARRAILYATWGRKSGCELLAEYGWSAEEMTDRLAEAYERAAIKTGAEVAPVGRCFSRILKRAPSIELYDKDRSHPSYAGSCLVALALYWRIFGELPKDAHTLNLDEDELEALKTGIIEN